MELYIKSSETSISSEFIRWNLRYYILKIDFEFSGSLIRECIRKMNYKYGKEKFISLLVQNQEIFKEIVKKINNDQFFINNRVKKVDTQRQPNANN